MALAAKEALKDGKVLNQLIYNVYKEPNINNLYALYMCLIDSDLYVPIKKISKRDFNKIKLLEKDNIITLKNGINIRPDWIKKQSNNKLYFPIFSNIEDSNIKYGKKISWMNFSIDKCIEFVDSNKECSGLILNAFSYSVMIEKDHYEFLKSVLKKVREKEINK